MTINDIPLDQIDAVIFDLDGTLYDKSRLHRLMIYGQLNHMMLMVRQQMERKLIRGRYFGSEPAFYKAYFGMMAHKQTFSPSYVRNWYFHSFMPMMVNRIQRTCKPYPWVLPLLEELKKHGKKVAVYSDYNFVREKLHALHINHNLFDEIISAPELGGLKPCVESMEGVIRLLGVKPERCLMVGDRDDNDGVSALRAGALYINVLHPENMAHIQNNSRYRDMQVADGTYLPDMGIDYPTDDPYVRLYKPVYDRNIKIDADYPYINDTWQQKLLNFTLWNLVLEFVLRLLNRLRSGMRYEGRENLKKYKKELAGGYISLGNHCLRHDCEAIFHAIRAKRTVKIPMYAPNFNTKDNIFLRAVGGIPIPPAEEGLSAMKKFNEAFDEFHRRGYSFHIFPEAAKWNFYAPIRPFQKGAFTMAYKYNMPLLPCVISYRPRTGIYRLFGPKNEPLITVHICEPILPDTTRPRKEEVERLRQEAHAAMVRAAGITHNPWTAAPDKE